MQFEIIHQFCTYIRQVHEYFEITFDYFIN